MTMPDDKQAWEEEAMWKTMPLYVDPGCEDAVKVRLEGTMSIIRRAVLPVAKEEDVAVIVNPYYEDPEEDPHVSVRWSPPNAAVQDAVLAVEEAWEKPRDSPLHRWEEPEDLARGFALGTMMAYEAQDYAFDQGWLPEDADLPAALHVFLQNYTLDGYPRERRILIRALAQVTTAWRVPLVVASYVWTWLRLRFGHSWRDDE